MLKASSMKALEDLGRVRLSPNFYMRDFLYSEIASFYGIPNIPDDPDLAIKSGTRLCEELLEPLQASFGRIAIRSAYRSCAVNEFGNNIWWKLSGFFNNFVECHWHERTIRVLCFEFNVHGASPPNIWHQPAYESSGL